MWFGGIFAGRSLCNLFAQTISVSNLRCFSFPAVILRYRFLNCKKGKKAVRYF
jgi:hypothetical protein